MFLWENTLSFQLQILEIDLPSLPVWQVQLLLSFSPLHYQVFVAGTPRKFSEYKYRSLHRRMGVA